MLRSPLNTRVVNLLEYLLIYMFFTGLEPLTMTSSICISQYVRVFAYLPTREGGGLFESQWTLVISFEFNSHVYSVADCMTLLYIHLHGSTVTCIVSFQYYIVKQYRIYWELWANGEHIILRIMGTPGRWDTSPHARLRSNGPICYDGWLDWTNLEKQGVVFSILHNKSNILSENVIVF